MQDIEETGDEAEEAKEHREARASDSILEEEEDETSENENEDENSSEEDEDEDTSENKSSDEDGQDTSEKPDKATQEVEEKNKKLFARAKKAEKRVKELEGKKGSEKKEDHFASVDPIELAKTVATLKDFSSDELDYVQLIAKGKGIPLDEAVKTDEVKTYIEAKREKAEGENKTPSPSSPSSVTGGKTEEELEKMDSKKFAKHVKEQMKGRKTGV